MCETFCHMFSTKSAICDCGAVDLDKVVDFYKRRNTMLSKMALGRKWAPTDHRNLQLSKYIQALPPPPVSAGYIGKVKTWPMMLNDELGDCTVAAAGHMVEQWTTYADNPVIIPDSAILAAYGAVGGYNPNDPSTDQGAVMADVLRYWRKTGIGDHKVVAYVSVNPRHHMEVKSAIELFGNCYVGIGLPITAQDPIVDTGGYPLWSVKKDPSDPSGNGQPWSWGGHCVPLVGYGENAKGAGTRLITWGQIYDMSWGFFDLYCDEAWAVVSQDWIDTAGKSVSGFDLTTLLADLKLVTA